MQGQPLCHCRLTCWVSGRIFQNIPELKRATLSSIGRVSDVHFGFIALHDLVGVTAGAKPGMILSRSLSAGGLRMVCRVVKCTSETRPRETSKINIIRDIPDALFLIPYTGQDGA